MSAPLPFGNAAIASRSLSFKENVSLRRLILAQGVELTASYAIYFASMALVEEKTHSSAQMGLMVFSSTLPGLLFGILAGVVVDRLNRLHILITGDLLRLLVASGFATAAHWLNSPLQLLITVYASNFLLATVAQFSTSAEVALLPIAVSQEHLLAANSILQVIILGAEGAGAVLLAPPLLKVGGAPMVGITAALLFVLAGWTCTRLPARLERKSKRHLPQTWASLRNDLRTGWRFIAGHALVRQAIGDLVLTSAISLTLVTLMPAMVARGWGVSVEYMPYLAIPGGLGFGLGVWLVGRRGHRVTEKGWISVGLLLTGIGLALLPLLHVLHGLYILLFLLASAGIGGGFALVVIPARTVVEERSPDEVRGRVVSTQMFLSNLASTLPLPLMGSLADAVGFQRVFALLALAVLGIWGAGLRNVFR